MSSRAGWSGRNRVENSTTFRSATRSGLDIFRDWLKISWSAWRDPVPHRCSLFRRHSPWQAAISTRLQSCDAGARITNTTGDALRNAAEQSKPSGFQSSVARRHDNRRRSGCAVDPVDGQLHERHEDVSRSVAAPNPTTILPAGLISVGSPASLGTC
jgi:hypothetical protein